MGLIDRGSSRIATSGPPLVRLVSLCITERVHKLTECSRVDILALCSVCTHDIHCIINLSLYNRAID